MIDKLTRQQKAKKIGPLETLIRQIAAMTPDEREAYDQQCAADTAARVAADEKQRATRAAQVEADTAAIRAAVEIMMQDPDLHARIQHIAEVIDGDDRTGYTGRGQGLYREHGVERTETAILQVSGVLRGYDKELMCLDTDHVERTH